MNGTIEFRHLEDMAAFLMLFHGSTAHFEAAEGNGVWLLTFTGAH
jgi:hypothetical protein